MPRPEWTPYRRDDGELIGWIVPDGDAADAWVPVDLFGRPVAGPVDWLDAEAALDEHGIGWLADSWMLEHPDSAPVRVRIVEVTPDRDGAPGRIVVQTDDFGAIDAPVTRFELPWPVPARLRPRRADDPDGRVWR